MLSNKQIIIIGKLNIRGHDQIKRIYSIDGIAPTLSTMQGGQRQPKIVTLGSVVNMIGNASIKEMEIE